MRLSYLAALAALILPFPALAFDANGTGHGTSMNEAMPVHEGLVVVKVASSYTGFDTDDPNNMLATANGPCYGTMIIDKGAVTGGGACDYTDADGDRIVMRWTPTGFDPEGRTVGNWALIGGTGKWMNASGEGAFNAGGDGDAYTNRVTGSVNMN
ncbi:hypothetical protein [Cognatishimia sp. F0-27]|uniref:hypothetical protein n=1 Tax=Cognatishimia sp. F0-27 TaxID=2816855 RepID=UPI001D0CC248|nr:hypothetical protein [Cognatishimia sp. F0-27]MCC1493822.1 hypothetical protein [Cognatishimia sp. F0-27]